MTHRRQLSPLVALLSATAVSVTGNRIALLAVPWFVLETTGSATKTGMTAFAHFLPMALAAFFGGAAVDRLGLRRSSVIADLLSSVTVLAIPMLYAAGLLEFWVLLALVFTGTLLDAPGDTARRALLPDLAELGAVPLERATSAQDSTLRITQMLGGPLAGLLIATLGAVNLLVIDAATFLISAALIGLFTRTATHREPAPGPADARSYWADLRAGLNFLRQDRLLPSILAVFMGANMLENALLVVLLPVYTEQVLDSPVALGLAVGAVGAGALTGALLYGAIGHRLPRRPVLLATLALAGAPKFLVMATLPDQTLMIATLGVAALASGPVNPLLGAVEYARIPHHLRGRVFGVITAAVVGAVPVGVLAAGVLADALPLPTTFLGMAAAYLAISLVPLLHPAWTERELQHAGPPAGPVTARRASGPGG